MNNTINQLTSELTNLASESKRRNADIKQASEKSLEILKTFNASKTPEQVFLKNLSKSPEFITPFLLSCQTRNPKYVSISISCFHRLITSQAIPITKLELVLDAFVESTNLAIEIQLKILQCLPFFFQNYSLFINDKDLFKLLSICSILQSNNKSNIVNNTASATLSQLINLVFEKISDEDRTAEIDKSYVVPIDNDETLPIGLNAYDGQRIFQDLCTLIEHQKPQYLKTSHITENFGFEILESVIKTNKDIFLKHVELGFLLRTKIVPILLRFFSSSKDFIILVRVSRLILLLIKEQFEILKIETEVILSLLNHILTKDSSSPAWKKILSLEIYKHILSDFQLVQNFFQEFDQGNDAKQIFNDYFQNCYDILNESRHLLNTGDVVQPPVSFRSHSQHQQQQGTQPGQQQQQQQQEVPGLFVSKSTLKINFIDLLDKADPPQVSETYPLYLILSSVNNFSEGACNFALNNASSSTGVNENNDNNDDKEKFFITELISKNFRVTLSIYQILIFSSLDQDLFNKTIRSLQKNCHASGVLSIANARDEFLRLLIKATLNLTGKTGFQHKSSVYSLGESIVGTISSTINQALTTTPTQTPITYTRQINSRNVLCFRVLIGLAISLGTVLQDNWKLIFMSLQWMDYYINGASNDNSSSSSSRDSSAPPPQALSSQDMINIENSVKKLNENINFYSSTVFNEIVKSVITLSSELLPRQNTNGMSIFYKQPVIDQGEGLFQIQPSSYNKIFYINKLMELSKINPRKFLIGQDQHANWSIVSNYYFEVVSNRSLNYEFRITISKDFNSIIRYMAIDGFQHTPPTITPVRETEMLILKSLDDFVKHLIALPPTEELLLLNCELEIQSAVLDTLKELLDKYGSSFEHWDLVFSIINSSFAKTSASGNDKKLMNSSFEALKFILDEFLGALPSNQLKILVDCISNFIRQQIDFNISLNSISYFWLVSDFLRASMKNKNPRQLSGKDELFQLVVEKNDDYHLLYIYLLYILSENIWDPRLQVRNGSIQTFFNIIDSHGGSYSQNWNNVYDIIFSEILKVPHYDTEWVESYYITLTGFVKLYIKFLSTKFDDDKIRYWKGLVQFCHNLVQINDIDLNLKIYKNFQDLITPFEPDHYSPPHDILETFFQFWSQTQIVYNLVQNNLYQDSLAALMECFPKLFQLVQPILNIAKYQQILRILNSCIKYPVLPDYFTNDDLRSTHLQDTVFRNLAAMIESTPETEKEYNSLLLQELNSIIILPFSTRDKIVAKFSRLNQQQQQNYKIPSFISIGHRVIDLLQHQLTKCHKSDSAYYINDGSYLKIYNSLLEPIALKATGISIKQALWQQAMSITRDIDSQFITLAPQDQSWWHAVVDLVRIINTYTGVDDDPAIEAIDLAYTNATFDLITDNISRLSETNLHDYVTCVYENSYLYEQTQIDTAILSRDSVAYFFSTSAGVDLDRLNDSVELVVKQRQSLQRGNLQKLVALSELSKIDAHYLRLRVAFAAWRVLNWNKLSNKCPVYELQQVEILSLLRGWVEILQTDPEEKSSQETRMLKPLVLQLIPVVHKIRGLDELIAKVLEII